MKKFKKGLEVVYLYTFEKTFKGFQNIYKKKIKSKTIKGIRDYFLKNWNQQNAGKQAKRMTNTTKQILNKVITDGQEAGLGQKDLVDGCILVDKKHIVKIIKHWMESGFQ